MTKPPSLWLLLLTTFCAGVNATVVITLAFRGRLDQAVWAGFSLAFTATLAATQVSSYRAELRQWMGGQR